MQPFIFSDFLPEYLSACALMGIGIGIDAAIVTSIRANHLDNRHQALWIFAITLTHTLFPMLGYLVSHTGVLHYPILSPLIGLIAFALIAYYLIQELLDSNESDETNHQSALINVGLILAVSWDALWSGPAKSAQVIDWPVTAVWSSFIVVGFIVALLNLASLYLVSNIRFNISRSRKNRWHCLGLWCQYSIFCYFGLLALLRYTFNVDINNWLLLSICCIGIGITLLNPLASGRVNN